MKTALLYTAFLVNGHHKLVPWGFVTHGRIDCYSRLVVYLQCSGNNRASTVYGLFLSAIRCYSLPSRVRYDHGRENYLVAVHVLEHRQSSMIMGISIHNQRIGVICINVLQYCFIDSSTILITKSILILTTIFIAMPCITSSYLVLSIQSFSRLLESSWCTNRDSMSPYRLFTAGALHLQRRRLEAVDFFESVDEMYGADEDLGKQDDYTMYVPPN